MAESHRLVRAGLDHQQALLERGREHLLHRAAGSPVAACSRRQLARPPRHAIASTICWDRGGMAATRAAEQPGDLGPAAGARAAGRRPIATRLPSRVSTPSRRSALSSSTVSYGLPRVCGSITSTRPAAVGRSACSMSATIVDEARRGQVVQPQVPHPGLLTPSGQQRRQRMRRVHVAVAVRAHQQQAVDRLLAQHQVDEAERRAPRPLQVIDEHHQRPLPRRDRAQHLRCRCAAPEPARSADRPRSGGTASSAANSGTTAVSRPAFAPTAARIRVADLGQLGLGLGQQQPAQRAKRLM